MAEVWDVKSIFLLGYIIKIPFADPARMTFGSAPVRASGLKTSSG